MDFGLQIQSLVLARSLLEHDEALMLRIEGTVLYGACRSDKDG